MKKKTEEKIRKFIESSQKGLEQSQKYAENEEFCKDTRMLFTGKAIVYSANLLILQSILEEEFAVKKDIICPCCWRTVAYDPYFKAYLCRNCSNEIK